MQEIAGQIKDVRVVVGSDSFRALLPTDLLGAGPKS